MRRRHLFRLAATRQGDTVTVDTWRSQDCEDLAELAEAVLAHVAEIMLSAESEGDWGFEMTRTELDAPEAPP